MENIRYPIPCAICNNQKITYIRLSANKIRVYGGNSIGCSRTSELYRPITAEEMRYIHPLTNDVDDAVVVVNCSKQRTFSGLCARGQILLHIWLAGGGGWGGSDTLHTRRQHRDLCALSLSVLVFT